MSALKPVCVAVWVVAGWLGATASWALPQGATPTLGSTTVKPGAAGTLEIVQTTAKAGIDWRSFSIAAGERVLIRQPDTAAVLFNRVTGADPSVILGQLQANGRVFLSNPRGIIFGAGSQVDVGSLVATTLAVNTTALANGHYQLSATSGSDSSAELRMDGDIRASGTVALVSPSLSVGGNILAGRLGLAAAGAVQVDVDGDGLIFFNVRDENLAARLRVLPNAVLRGGSAELRAAARSGFADTVLNLEGVVRAQGLAMKDGQVVIDGGSAGTTRLAGTVDVSNTDPGARGGGITVLGDTLWLDHTARLDARGDAGGGRILVGGNWQGQGAERPAEHVRVSAGALLDASAIRLGDGGRVVVWSDGSTRFDGSILARGGLVGGHGGEVETSGKRQLGIQTGQVDARAQAAGFDAGRWLLDPADIVVATGGTATTGQVDQVGDAGATLTIAPDTLRDAAANIELQASNSISINNVVGLTSAGKSFTARAGGSITVASAATVSTNNGAITLSANDAVDAANITGGVVLNAGLNAGTAAVLITNNGGTTAHQLGAPVTSGNFTLTGAASLSANVVLDIGGTGAIANGISGVGFGLTKQGAGTLTLAGANTYTGATTVDAGSLVLGPAAGLSTSSRLVVGGGSVDLGTRAFTLAGVQLTGGSIANGTLTSTSAYDLQAGTVSAVLGGAVALNKTTAGTVSLSGANTYSQGTTVVQGRLEGNATSLQGAIVNDALVVFDQAAAGTYDGVMSGSGGLSKQGAAPLTLTGVHSYIGTTTVNAGDLELGPAAGLSTSSRLVVNGGGVDLGGGAFTLAGVQLTGGSITNGTLTSSSAYDLQAGVVNAVLAGTVALNKTTAGTVSLGGANTLSGATSVAGGTLQLNNAHALDFSAVTLADLAGVNLSLLADSTVGSLAGTGTIAGNGSLSLGNQTLRTGGAGNSSFAGVVTGTGALVKQGGSIFLLTGSNSHSGGTTVAGGTLLVGSDAALGAGALTLDGGTLRADTSFSLGASRSVVVGSGGGGINTNGVGVTLDIAGVLSGGGPLSKTGDGALRISGAANTYGGATTVSAGTLVLGSATALALSAVTLADVAGVTLVLDTSSTIGSLAGTGTSAGNGTVSLGGQTLTTGNSDDSSFAGIVSGSGGLNKQGTGHFTLSGASTYTGTTTVDEGSLVLGPAAGLLTSSVVVNGGSLDLGGRAFTLTGVRLAGGAISNGTLTSTSAFDLRAGTVSAVLAGGVALDKSTIGEVTLGATNTYTGGTTVGGGTLVISADSALGASTGGVSLNGGTLRADTSLTLAATRAVEVGNAGGALSAHTVGVVLDLDGVLSGSAALGKAGAGTLRLNGTANTYTGALTVSAGNLALNSAQALAGNAVTLADAAGVSLSLLVDSTVGSLAGTGTDVGHGTLSLGSKTLHTGSGSDSSFAGVVTGTGTLVKQGGSVFTLTGSSSHSGGTTVTGGTLLLGGDAALGAGALTLDGGTLRADSSFSLGAGRSVVVGNSGGGFNTNGAGVTLEVAGVLSGGGALGKSGDGTLALTGSNTHSGTTRVSAGTLAVASGAALSDTNLLTLDSSGRLRLDAAETLGALDGSGTVDLGSFTLSTGNGSDTTFAGVIGGSGGLRKIGAGNFTLSGANTFSGATTVQAGRLTLNHLHVLDNSVVTLADVAGVTLALQADATLGGLNGVGSIGGLVDLGSATLHVGNAGDHTLGSAIIGNGALVKQGSGALTLTGANTYGGGTTVSGGTLAVGSDAALGATSGALTLAGGTLQADTGFTLAAARSLVVDTAGGTLATPVAGVTLDIAGVLSGSGPLAKTGDGTLRLSGTANTYSGDTTVSGGTLQLASATALAHSALTLADAAGVTLALDLNSTIASLAGGGTVNGTVDLGVFTLTTGGAAGTTFAGVIGSGGGGLVKQGAGNFTLAGANTYTGATLVNAGTLTLDNALALDHSAVTLADVAGVRLALAGSSTIASLAGSGAANSRVELAGHTLSTGNADSTRYEGVIAGTGGLVKQGAGSFTLAGVNTYSGTTTVNAGTLRLDNAHVLDHSRVTLADVAGVRLALDAAATIAALDGVGTSLSAVDLAGHTLSTGNTTDSAYAGVISGSGGALVKQGSGRFTLTGANTYSGGTRLAAGTLAIDDNSALGANTGVLTLAGGTLQADTSLSLPTSRAVVLGTGGGTVDTQTHTLTLAGPISGNTALGKAGSGTLVVSGNTNTFSGSTLVADGTLQLASAQALANSVVTLADSTGVVLQLLTHSSLGALAGGGAVHGTVDLGGFTLSTGNIANTTFAGSIGGSGGLVKQGSGRFTLTGSNPYSGGTVVNAGTLAIDDNAALGANTGALTLNGGTLQAAASMTLPTSRAVVLGSGGGTVDTQGHTLTLAGPLSGSTALTKGGSGVLAISGSGNPFSGTTLVAGGTLQLASAQALAGSAVTLADTAGVALQLLTHSSLASLAGGGAVNGVVDLGSFTLTSGGSADTTFAGTIVGSGGLVKQGAGSLALTGTSTYSGGTVVNAGALVVDDNAALGASTGALTLAGGTLRADADLSLPTSRAVVLGSGGGTVDSQAHTLMLAGPLSGSTVLTKVGSGALAVGGAANTFTGNTLVAGGTLQLASAQALAGSALTLANAAGVSMQLLANSTVASLAGGGAVNGTVDLGTFMLSTGNAANTTFTGVIGGSGGLVKQGTGRFTLAGANTFSGGTAVNAGTLRLNNTHALDASTVTLADAPGVTLALQRSSTVGALAGGGVSQGVVDLGSFTLSTGAAGDSRFAGVIGGAGGLLKQGSSRFTLAGANTYTGSTTVAAGTLAIDHAAALAQSAVVLANTAGATLALDVDSQIGSLAGGGASGGQVALGSHAVQVGVDGRSTTFAGSIVGSGSLVKQGSGLFTLTGANGLTGATRVEQGGLALGHAGALAGSALTLVDAAGVSLQLLADSSIASLSGGGVVNGAVDLGAFTLRTGSATDTTYAGAISGSGGLVKQGTGSFTLSGDNHHGSTTIAAGSLVVDADHRLGATGAALVLDGGQLRAAGDLALAASRPVTLGAAGGSFDTQGHSLTVSGNISGPGGLGKTGSGTLVLAGANTYGGATTLGAGILSLANLAALPAGTAVSLANVQGLALALQADAAIGSLAGGGAQGGGVQLNGFTLTVGADGSDTTFNGVISGSGGLHKTGAGSLTLSGSNSFTGSATVAQGSLQLAGGTALVDSVAVSLADQAGAALVLQADETIGSLAGGGSQGGEVQLGMATLTTGGNGASTSFAGAFSGSGAVLKQGGGSFTLAGASRHTGDTTVAAGTLVLAHATPLATSTVVLADAAGAGLALQADATIGALSGGGPAGGAVDLGSFTLSTGASGASSTYAGVVAGSGGLSKTGAGSFSLSGVNTFSGPVTVQAGSLVLLGGAALADTVTVTLADATGALLQLQADETLGALAGGGVLGGGVALGGFTLTVASNSADTVYAGALAGSGSLVKQGAGRLTLAGTSTFSGATQVDGGTLVLAGGTALPDGAAVTLADAAGATLALAADETLGSLAGGGAAGGGVALGAFTLTIGGTGASSTLAGGLSGSGGLVKQGAGSFTLAGTNTYTGGTAVAAGTLVLRGGAALADSALLTLADATGAGLLLESAETIGALAGGGVSGGGVALGDFTLSTGAGGADSQYGGVISGRGGLVKQGSGRFTLSGINSFSGTTTVEAGTLVLQGGTTLADSAAVVLANVAGARLALGANETLGSLAGGGAAGGELALGAFSLRTGGNGSDTVFAGPISGRGGLVKQGSGRFTLAGANTYTGSTTVASGTLVLQGGAALADTAAVVLADAAGAVLSLQGDEAIGALAGGAADVAGHGAGQLQLGNSTLTTGGAGADTTFAGVLGGAGRLVKQGSGSFTLTGLNTYTGGTTLAGGTLVVAGDAQLGQAPASATTDHLVFDGGTLRATDSFTLAASRGVALGGGGATLQVDADKTLLLPGLLADGAGAGAAGTLHKTGSGTLQLVAANTYRGATQVLGGVLAIAGDTQLGTAPAAGVAQQLVLDGGTLRIGADTTLAAHRGLWLGAAGGTVDVQAGTVLDVPGSIGGEAGAGNAGSLVKRGDGRLTLSNPLDNAYPGATQVLAGTLAIGRDGHLGAAPAVATPGQLLIDDATLQVDGSLQLDARRGLAIGDAGATVSVAGAQTLAYAGVLADAGTGAGTLVKTGAGQFSLQGTAASPYRGATVVEQGVLAVTADHQLGAVPAVATAGHLRLDGGTLLAAASLVLAAQRGLELGAAGGTLDVAAGHTLAYGGVLADAGSGGRLLKAGAGQLQFTGAQPNTYAGGTSLLAGQLLIDRDEQLGAAPQQAAAGQLLLDGGTLQFAAGSTTELDSRRGLALGAAGGAIDTGAGARVAYNGVIADASGLPQAGGALVKAGSGQLTLGGDNQYRGATRVLAGTLATAGAQRLPDGGGLQLAQGARVVLGGDETVAALADAEPLLASSSARIVLGAHTLTVHTPLGSESRYSGDFTAAGGGLVKRGEGQLALAGDGVGSSQVQVDEGLLLSVGANSLSADAAVTVRSGATLQLQAEVAVKSLLLGGQLGGPGGLRTDQVTLDGGQVGSSLHAATLTSHGASGLGAAVAVSGSTTVDGGRLTLGAGGSLQSTRLDLTGAGTLATTASGQLAGDSAVVVAAGSQLQLAGREAVASLSLAGSLASTPGGAGALDVAGATQLQGGTVDTTLTSTTLTSQGSSLVNAAVRATDRATVRSGRLTVGAAGLLDTPQLAISAAGTLATSAAPGLAADTAVVVQAGGNLAIGGDTTVQSLQLFGTLGSAADVTAALPQLTVTNTVLLDGAAVATALATPLLSVQGNTTFSAPVQASSRATLVGGDWLLAEGGALAGPLLQLNAGTLRSSGAQQIDAATALQMTPGARLQLGGDQVLASLADGAATGLLPAASLARVELDSHDLAVGAGGQDTVFSGQLVGSGSLVKQGTGTWVLRAEQAHGGTRIEAGTLQLGDGVAGGTGGSLGTGAVINHGTLRLQRSGDVELANTISGTGTLQHAGSGQLTLASTALTYTGDTQVLSGVLRTTTAERLPDGSRVQVAAAARLVLGGDETLQALDADGAVSLGGSLTSSGDQRYGGAVSVTSGAPITLTAPGARIEALHDDNRWGEQPLSVHAGQLRLSAGRQAGGTDATGLVYRDLVLGSIVLGGLAAEPAPTTTATAQALGTTSGNVVPLAEPSDTGSSIDAGRLQLGRSPAPGQAATGDARLDGLLRLDGGSLLLRAHAAASYQPLAPEDGKSKPVDPLKGRDLWVADDVLTQSSTSQVSTAAGSQLTLQASGNGSIRFEQAGNQFVGGLSALSGAEWNSAWAPVERPGGREVGQSRISLQAEVLNVGGAGLEADLVRLSADRLATAPGSVIVARLWYNDSTYGQQQSTPGLQLTLRPAAFGSAGSFGTADLPLAVNVGSKGLGGGREGLNAGYVQVLPRQGAQGATAVFLAGPKVGEQAYSFFHDGAGDQAELPVFYNGVLPATPQLSGSLSAVASVSETARRERFEEAIRTENVAIRLRAGVIAEVGPGRSATQGTQGIKLPLTCAAADGQLGCGASTSTEPPAVKGPP